MLVKSTGPVLALVYMPAPVCGNNIGYVPVELVTGTCMNGVPVSTVGNCGAGTDIVSGTLWLAFFLADAAATIGNFFLFLGDRLSCADMTPKRITRIKKTLSEYSVNPD